MATKSTKTLGSYGARLLTSLSIAGKTVFTIQEARQILGEGAEIASAFQNISHEHLLRDEPVECDVLVVGTSKNARQQTLKLVEDTGLVGWDAGPLENAVVVEGLTSVLININKQYGVQSSGIRITGVTR